MVAVLLMIVGLGLAETEQNYYVTRNSIPYIEQSGLPQPPRCPKFPSPMCDDPPFVMDILSWNSTELKDGVVDVTTGEAQPILGGGNCTIATYPPSRCPGPDMGCCMGVKTWNTREMVKGGLVNGAVTVLASECVTYSLCGHRIYYSREKSRYNKNRTTRNEVNGGGGGPTVLLPDTPLQYIEAQASAPHVTKLGIISSGCEESDYPTPPPCNTMHLYVGQENWHEPVFLLSGAVEVALSSTAASTSACNSVDNGSSRSSSARGDAAGGVGISVDHTTRPFADGKLLPFLQDVQLFGAYGVGIAALVITADIATFKTLMMTNF
eukprot:gene15683-5273_t